MRAISILCITMLWSVAASCDTSTSGCDVEKIAMARNNDIIIRMENRYCTDFGTSRESLIFITIDNVEKNIMRYYSYGNEDANVTLSGRNINLTVPNASRVTQFNPEIPGYFIILRAKIGVP